MKNMKWKLRNIDVYVVEHISCIVHVHNKTFKKIMHYGENVKEI